MTLGSLTQADVAAVPAEVVERLHGARDVLTVCHENPEADALGSALGLALALETLGKRATPLCSDVVPPMYDFMPHIDRFRRDPETDHEYDLIVVGDCGDLARVGSVLGRHAELFGRVPIVNIDHHISNPGFGAVNWVDATAAATCEMDTLLMPALGVPLDAADGAIAANLMAGVVIDTANFQHPNVTPRTLRVAAELVAAGAPLSDTARLLYRTKPNRQLKLFGLVLGRLDSQLDGRLVWSALYSSDYEASGASVEDTEGLSDLLSQSASAAIMVLFRDMGERTKISVRTRDGGPDATVLTGMFGGGGHARASGATLPMPIAAAIPVVLEAARQQLAERRG
ncbi:MAG: bifunctional oligoribonuclease and phosphatase NrnA [Chloroflexota bacterium]|nr:bifunctional oligoribonuclease and phosphatase NrnA [Chloroflexota bacterium]